MSVIGLDVGTTTLSAVVLDALTGETLETLSCESAAHIDGQSWEDLQHPDMIVWRAHNIISQLTSAFGPVDAIGLTGQMHGIVYLDAQGNAVSPLYTWQDARGEEKMPGGDKTYVQKLTALTGYPMATGFGLLTHYWHIENKCIPEGATGIATIHDYVGMKLTGRKTALTHVSDAASLGLFDKTRKAFDISACEKAGIDPSFLPEVVSDCQTLGQTNDGIPVSVAIGDNQAGFIGTVREIENSVMVNVGTSGQVSMMANVNNTPSAIESRPLNGDANILVGSTLCGGRAYVRLEAFFRSCLELAGVESGDLYAAMNKAGAEALSYDDKLIVDTRFSGTRQQPNLRGFIQNIDTHNLTANHLTGALLEGIARELHDLYTVMLDSGAPMPSTLIGAGNALRKNPALVKALESAFYLKMQIPLHREEAAYGAALFGLAAANLVPGLADAQKLIRYLEL